MGDWIDDTLELNKHIFNTFFDTMQKKMCCSKVPNMKFSRHTEEKKGACHS